MKFCATVLIMFYSICIIAQTNSNALQLAKKQMMEGNYDEAATIYKQALTTNAKDMEVAKDYAYMLCLLKNFTEAENIIKPFVLNDNYDVQTAQIAALSFKGQGRYDVAEQLYIKSLVKFPLSAVLYNETGELYAIINNLTKAITYWEKGISIDSNFSTNYYNAAMYYHKVQQQPLKVIWYAEIFANLESYSTKTFNSKEVLFNTYKFILNEKKLEEAINNTTNPIEKQLGLLLAKNLDAVASGISTETLTGIRTRVLLDWQNNQFGTHKLMLQHQYLLRNNLFAAYNIWLLEAYANPAVFNQWKQTYNEQYSAFESFQKSRLFKITQ